MDFPAARGMDSTWSAVDADEYVAAFRTQEDDPLPRARFTAHTRSRFGREAPR